MHSCQIVIAPSFVQIAQCEKTIKSEFPSLIAELTLFSDFLRFLKLAFLCKMQENDCYKVVTNITALFILYF